MSNSSRRSDDSSLDDQGNEGTSDDVRQRAYDLLNRMGGPDSEEDVKEWPQSPAAAKRQAGYSSYQQGHTADDPISRSRTQQGNFFSPRTFSEGSSSFSLAESFVNCVSGACKLASSEVLSQPAAVLRTGYDSLRTVVLPEVEDRFFASRSKTYAPVSGTYQTVDVSQGCRGRYSDTPQGNQR
jgi:hypothetical protein